MSIAVLQLDAAATDFDEQLRKYISKSDSDDANVETSVRSIAVRSARAL